MPRVAALAALCLVLVSGCASSGPQSLDVGYSTSEVEMNAVTVDFGTVQCDDFGGSDSWSIKSDETESYPEERPTFRATMIGRVTGVSLLIGDGLIFVSSKPFTITSDGVTFDDQPGTVSRVSGSESVIDADAVLNGTVSC